MPIKYMLATMIKASLALTTIILQGLGRPQQSINQDLFI